MDQRGPIISWFPIRTFPEPQNFPIRNRIIAGITLGTAALGGAQSRGSFVAARLAMEFGREVFSVPGNATEPSQFGPNQLTKLRCSAGDWLGRCVEELPTPGCAELLPVETSTVGRACHAGEQDRAPTEHPMRELLSMYE